MLCAAGTISSKTNSKPSSDDHPLVIHGIQLDRLSGRRSSQQQPAILISARSAASPSNPGAEYSPSPVKLRTRR
jgi:hypothetical protein